MNGVTEVVKKIIPQKKDIGGNVVTVGQDNENVDVDQDSGGNTVKNAIDIGNKNKGINIKQK